MTAKAHPCHGLLIGLHIAIIATRPPLRQLRLLRAVSSRPRAAMPVFDRFLFEANQSSFPRGQSMRRDCRQPPPEGTGADVPDRNGAPEGPEGRRDGR